MHPLPMVCSFSHSAGLRKNIKMAPELIYHFFVTYECYRVDKAHPTVTGSAPHTALSFRDTTVFFRIGIDVQFLNIPSMHQVKTQKVCEGNTRSLATHLQASPSKTNTVYLGSNSSNFSLLLTILINYSLFWYLFWDSFGQIFLERNA